MRIFIDMETIPDQRENALAEIMANITPPGQYKKPESIQKWMDENAEEMAREELHKTGLNGLYGEICSIAWIAGDAEQTLSITRGIDCDTEVELLQKFWRHLEESMYEEGSGFPGGSYRDHSPEWVGHNVIDFDLRFLKQRSIVRGVKPRFLIPADARHGSHFAFDTMKEWAGWRGYVSLESLCKALGIPVKPGEIHGSDVWRLWQEKDYAAIKFYNESDVEAVRAVYGRMKFHD